MNPEPLYAFLAEQGIDYRRHDHPPVFTCQEAERLVPAMAAARTKNVFVRDRPGKRHFLVVVGYDKRVDLKRLAEVLETSKLSLGSPERLMKHLGVEPGSVTILGLLNDQQGQVELVLDQPIAEAPSVRCHPLVNTSTLELEAEGLTRFLEATGHQPRIIAVPGLS
ncbi:MAG: prolyl-tRNA synthetase associated domain-containing protein [Candidatus Eremiobacteraeota bacterium]|nr:prolyl-tRNA synthetase associated domain-containing protein [Candidatus Eremiobacteraeota bacterium]